MGVGNELNGDDAAGMAVVRAAKRSLGTVDTVLWIEAGPTPESFSGPVCRYKPDLLLVIDAARLELRPGQIAWIQLEEIDGVSAFTHGLPLSLLAGYIMAETGCQFGMLGIQVEQTELGRPISVPVIRAVKRVTEALRTCVAPL
jgi:hydrogenase 3 maturation protease